MLPKKIVTRVIRANGNVWKRTKVIKKKMKRNEGCEKDYNAERRGEETRCVVERERMRSVSRSFMERAQGGVHIIFF